jgi:hypothetical protein
LGGYCRPDTGKAWDVMSKKEITSSNCVNNKVTTAESGSSVLNDVCEPFGPSESTDYGFVR